MKYSGLLLAHHQVLLHVLQKNEREAVKAGKGVFFQKRSEKKRQELIRRYEELKATGRLDKVMAKRQKRNAAKDHRYVPSTRRQTE